MSGSSEKPRERLMRTALMAIGAIALIYLAIVLATEGVGSVVQIAIIGTFAVLCWARALLWRS